MKHFLFFGLLCTSLAAAQLQVVPPNDEPILKNPGSPKYPPLARVARVQGKVILEFVVNHDGDVASVMVVSGPAMLSEVAAYIVNTWKFQMPKSNSLEDLHLETVFDYVLDDGSAGSQPPVVFDSFHHVTFRTEPMMIDHAGC